MSGAAHPARPLVRWLLVLLPAAGLCACGAMWPRRAVTGDPAPSKVPAPAAATPFTITLPSAPSASSRPTGATLSVQVRDLRNHKGVLIFGVFSQAAGFPNVERKSVYWEVRDAGAEDLTFTARLPPGTYSASVLHDENRSGEMDRGFGGLPLEGYGVTNNPKPKMRAATFKEATFTLPPEGTGLTISLQYQFL